MAEESMLVQTGRGVERDRYHRLPAVVFLAALTAVLAGCGGYSDLGEIEYAKMKVINGERDYLFELTDGLETTDEPRLRLAIIEALDEIGDRGAAMALVRTMKSDEDLTVRLAVPPVLARMQAVRSVEPLAEMMSSDDPQMRQAALLALRQMRDVPISAFLPGLQSTDGTVQAESVKALGRQRDPELIPIFFSAFFDPVTGPQARGQIVSELGKLGEEGLDALYHMYVQSDDEGDRADIRRELEASPSDRAVRLLAELDGEDGDFGWDLSWENPRGAEVVYGEVIEVNIVSNTNASLMLVTDRGRHVHCHFDEHTDELLYIKSEMAAGPVRVGVGGAADYIEEMTHIWAETIQIVP